MSRHRRGLRHEHRAGGNTWASRMAGSRNFTTISSSSPCPICDVVTTALSRLGVRLGPIDANAALGLALVRDLANVDAAVRTLQQDADIGPELARFEDERAQASARLTWLTSISWSRASSSSSPGAYPGWKVTIGKNYRPSPVKGYPHVVGGGDGDPEPTEALLSQLMRPARRPRAGPRGTSRTARHPHVPRRTADRQLRRPRRGDLLDPGQGPFTIFDGHCAFVGSCILQQAPAAELHVRPVLDSDGDGSAWDAAVAMAEIAQTGVDVVNLSFGEVLTDDNSRADGLGNRGQAVQLARPWSSQRQGTTETSTTFRLSWCTRASDRTRRHIRPHSRTLSGSAHSIKTGNLRRSRRIPRPGLHCWHPASGLPERSCRAWSSSNTRTKTVRFLTFRPGLRPEGMAPAGQSG